LSRVRASISVRSKRAVLGVKRDVKSVLTDQQIIAGIGNIYSDEILFQARIDSAGTWMSSRRTRLSGSF
jgi:formamidopyrimidine-DNA glycosylase